MRIRYTLFVAALVGTGACTDRPAAEDLPEAGLSSFSVDRSGHDFGRVPIDGGVVEAVFHVVNDGPDQVRLLSVSTSCGCTTALAVFTDGSTVGSYDAPAGSQDAGRIVRTGESFQVQVKFDPAAHGPNGVGQLMREVILATLDGVPTRLVITADVFRG
ncbi:MAG: DUF1573 domain-containing protein [Acidimicrobiia bacterium]|nr:DUF1573 domain-containing protein [Acidimicrobiia bacterium]